MKRNLVNALREYDRITDGQPDTFGAFYVNIGDAVNLALFVGFAIGYKEKAVQHG